MTDTMHSNDTSLAIEVDDTAGRQPSSSVDASGATGVTQNRAPFTGSVEVGGGDFIPPARPEDYNQPKSTTGDDTQPSGADTIEGGQKEPEVTKQPETEAEAPKPLPELPEFKADDEAVVKTYTDAFMHSEGHLNMEALSQQWWANNAANGGKDGHLSEGTYAFLESKGLRREDVKNFERAQVALNAQEDAKVHEVFGGKSSWDRAIQWAVEGGGYAKDKQAEFDRAYAAGGTQREEAVALLFERFTAAARSAPTSRVNASGGATGTNPKTNPNADVFNTREEWTAARKAAGDDNEAQAKVSAKFHRSPAAHNW